MFDRWIFHTPAPEPTARLKYGRGPFQIGELRLPEATGRRHPTLLVVHGGFWLAQFDRAHVTHLCARLSEIGIATWCLEFRRLGNLGGGFPKTFRDVATGADFVTTLGDRFQLDLSRLAVLGHSAGGHLGTWLAARPRLSSPHSLYSDQAVPISKVFSLAGVSDLHQCHSLDLCDNVVEHLMGGSPEHQPARYAAACPTKLLPIGVEQMIFHGRDDPLVPVSLNEAYARAAQRAGDTVHLEVLDDTGHFELIDPRTEAWGLVERALTAHFELPSL